LDGLQFAAIGLGEYFEQQRVACGWVKLWWGDHFPSSIGTATILSPTDSAMSITIRSDGFSPLPFPRFVRGRRMFVTVSAL
jgi:hypothetical protein